MDAHAPPEGLVGLLRLSRRVREAGSVEELGFIAVNETRGLLDYRQAALWLADATRPLASLSGVARPDPGAPFAQWIARLFRTTAPVAETRRLEAAAMSPLLREEWAEWLPAHALLVPLSHPRLAAPGVLLLAREAPWEDADVAVADELGRLYGHALFALRPARHPRAWLASRLRGRAARWRLLAVLLLVALFPVRLSVLAPAEVTAVRPDVMRAPIDGIVARVHVRPNQAVAAQTPLFELDATALRGQHASAGKALEAAREQYRQAAQLAVTDDGSRIEMAQRLGEMRLREVELEYAAEQLSRVQVAAPRAGVAVFDDINEWTGKAVATGERVMMLADPARVELTAFMPAGDQVALAEGATVVFHPSGSPLSAYRAQVTTVAYRAAATGEGVLAYRVTAALEDGQAPPRLGLSGTARLHAGRVPLAYYLLRRPLVAVRQWLGW